MKLMKSSIQTDASISDQIPSQAAASYQSSVVYVHGS